MIGWYSLAGVKGREFNLRDLLKTRVCVVDDYRGRLGRSVYKELIESNHPFILHDYMGFYSGGGDVYRVRIGVDTSIPLFNLDIDLEYLSLYEDVLNAILTYYGIREHRWRLIFSRGVDEAIRRGEPTLKSVIEELAIIRSESTGFEREAYTLLITILKGVFTEEDLNRLSRESYIEFERLRDKKVIFDYTGIKSPIGRLFIEGVATIFSSIYLDSIQVIPYYDYMTNLKISRHWLSNSYVIFLNSFDPKVINYVDTVIMPSRLYRFYRRYMDKPVIESLDTDYILIDGYITIFINVPEVEVKPPDRDVEAYELNEDYIEVYRDEVIKILNIVLESQKVSVDGIFIQSGINRHLLYSLVDRLWRDGYLKRVVEKGNILYRISVKGMKLLRGGGDA